MAGNRHSFLTGRRGGTAMMIAGGVMSGLAALLVLGLNRGAQAAPGDMRQAVRETYVVVATKDIPELATIKTDSVALKAFPAAYVPAGAAVKVDDVVGKVAAAPIVRDQLVLQPQVRTLESVKTPSVTIPADKVVFWMPMPELLAQANALRPGDKVDILLSVGLAPANAPANGQNRSLTTQTTLQGVEIYAVGNAVPDGTADKGTTSAASKTAPKNVAFLMDPQDAVLAKFIKDASGTIDLVLRSRESSDPVRTEAVTADTLVERFAFRVPQRWTTAK